jgi:hypothetical protein
MIAPHRSELHGARVLEYSAGGPVLLRPQDATDIIGEALAARADWVYLPMACLSEAFFDLRSGLAGEVLQKFANYRVSLAIAGDTAPLAAGNQSLRDFIREANCGRQLAFVADYHEFQERLARDLRSMREPVA